MHTVNVYTLFNFYIQLCLIFIYILIHGAKMMGIFGGKLTIVTVMFRLT